MKKLSIYLSVLLVVLLGHSSSLRAQCTTQATEFFNTTQAYCAGQQIYADTLNNHVLDANDIMQFVLFTGDSPLTGTVLATSYSPVFAWDPIFQQASPIKMVAIAGNAIPFQGALVLDYTDPCLDMSNPVEITITPAPTIIANGGVLSCLQTSVTLVASSSTAGATFVWAGPGGFSNTQQNPSASVPGIYTVVATSPLGCTNVAQVQVIADSQLPLVVPAIEHISCFGAASGSINITNGNPNYTYNWSIGQTGTSITNLAAGVYMVTITDSSNGCTSVQAFTINGPSPLTVGFQTQSNCSGTTTALVTGGSAPYTYEWNNGVTTPTIVPFALGTYIVTITDANGCSTTSSITITPSPGDECGYIKGKVYTDTNDNCTYQAGEQGLNSWTVTATGQGAVFYGNTYGDGDYLIQVPLGNFVVTAAPPNPLWESCQATYAATLTASVDSAIVNMGQKIEVECSALEVHLNTPLLRRCFSDNYYYVSYCNHGSIAAEDAYIVVELDNYLTYLASSVPGVSLGNNAYRFDVGDLAAGDCGNFHIQVNVSCNAVLGQTHCSQATIYPYDADCAGGNANWSGASLNIEAECDADSLRFTLSNVGTAAMTIPLDYIVIEDVVMFMQGNVIPPLAVGESREIALPANGATWHIEAEQEPFHPGNSSPSLTIEGCANNSNFTVGLVNQFSTNDADPWIDINCRPNQSSYDPNDKRGFPIGYGAAHYVKPGTLIEYVIRFQNTGTDTAFNIRVVDTLAAWLDPTSIQLGASSHAYEYRLKKNGIIEFAFNDIMLPDSFVNEPLSHGFISFTIAPKVNMPLNTVVNNDAAIYFDFNDPIITNTTQHTFAENFIVLSAWQPVSPSFRVAVYPNPVVGQANIVLQGYQNPHADLLLEIYNATGSLVKSYSAQSADMVIDRTQLPEGIYTFRVSDAQDGLLGSGRLIVK